MKKFVLLPLLVVLLFTSCRKPPVEEPAEWIRGKYFADNGCSYPVIQVLDSTHYHLGEKMNANNKEGVYLFRVDNCDFKSKGFRVGEELYFGILPGTTNCVVCDILPAVFPAKHHKIASKKL